MQDQDGMASAQPLRVKVGVHVELDIHYEGGETEQLSLDIVPDNAADFARGLLGESTQLAKAIIGHEAGAHLPYRVGDAVRVHLRNVMTGLYSEPVDLTDRREDTLRRAVKESDRANAIIFASSMNSKWGDYDPSGIEDW